MAGESWSLMQIKRIQQRLASPEFGLSRYEMAGFPGFSLDRWGLND